MSVSHHSYVIAGYRLSDLVRIQRRTQTVTRYHKKTGQPCQREEVVLAMLLLGKEVPLPAEERYPGEWPFLKMKGTQIVDIGGMAKDFLDKSIAGVRLDQYVWGIVLAQLTGFEGEGVAPLTTREMMLASSQMARALHKLADRVDTTVPFGLEEGIFLVGSVSC